MLDVINADSEIIPRKVGVQDSLWVQYLHGELRIEELIRLPLHGLSDTRE